MNGGKHGKTVSSIEQSYNMVIWFYTKIINEETQKRMVRRQGKELNPHYLFYL